MSTHIHEQGEVATTAAAGYLLWASGYLWRCKHCVLQRSKSWWQRYRANLKQIMETIAANGLPDHEAREEHAWSNSFDGMSPSPWLVRQIIHAYLTWQEEE